MSEDNRLRPHIIRVLPAVNKRVRAYAERQGVAPNVAAEDLMNGAAGEIAALDQALVALRADLESAREATRRADAALAEAKRTADKLRLEVERVTEERDTERRLDVAAQEALRADVAREIETNRKLEAELAEVRAALETKGAAAALPDDLAPRLAAIAARRDVEPHVMLAKVIKNGISTIEASAKYQDAQKAARART